jgi:FeS assembly protein SufD
MTRNTTKQLNNLPVITYRWLKLNHLSLDTELDQDYLPFSKDYLANYNANDGMDPDIILRKMNGPIHFPDKIASLMKDRISYGVSEELVAECENSYNSGIYLYVPEGKNVPEPIRVEYSMDETSPRVIDHNLIYAEANSRVTIVIDYSTIRNTRAYHNGAMQIYAKEGSVVNVIKLQRMNDEAEHFDSNIAFVERDAKVNYIQIELGAKHSVTNYRTKLGEAGEATIACVYFGDGNRLIDMSYLMEHLERRSISNIQVKGALKDQAIKTFRGTIDFKTGASKSEGSEEEYVILFDKQVKSNAIPLLLCSEDDVKGQHAASAGKVDSDKLFYMMSRGFTKEEAMKLIVEASFRPVIEKVPFRDLREIISEEIHRRLLDERI